MKLLWIAVLMIGACNARAEDVSCWTPDNLVASAPDAESRASIHALSDQRMADFLAISKERGKQVPVEVASIWVARNSTAKDTVLLFDFNFDGCLINRGAIKLTEWRSIFGHDKEL